MKENWVFFSLTRLLRASLMVTGWPADTGATCLPVCVQQRHRSTSGTTFPRSSVQSLSRVQLFAAPWITARQASLSITNSWSPLRLTSIESVMPSSHLILCRPLLLLPPIPPSESFPNEPSANCPEVVSAQFWNTHLTQATCHSPPSSVIPSPIYLVKVDKRKWGQYNTSEWDWMRLHEEYTLSDTGSSCLQLITLT